MLTVVEVARLIRKEPETVRELARRGKLPGAQKLGGAWMFQRPVIDKFVSGQ